MELKKSNIGIKKLKREYKRIELKSDVELVKESEELFLGKNDLNKK